MMPVFQQEDAEWLMWFIATSIGVLKMNPFQMTMVSHLLINFVQFPLAGHLEIQTLAMEIQEDHCTR